MKVYIVRENNEDLGDDFSAFMQILKEILPKVRVFLLSDGDPDWLKQVLEREKIH